MSKKFTILVALGLLGGCCGPAQDGLERLDDSKTAQEYFDALTGYAGSATVTECRMFGASRKGRCRIAGTEEGLRALGDKLEYTPAMAFEHAYGDQTCLREPGFGVVDDKRATPVNGVIIFAPPSKERWYEGPWPHTDKNVLPGHLFWRVDTGEVCFEFSYPYG